MGDMFLRKEQYLTAGLWAWGDNNYGSVGGWLGLGDAYDRSSPSQVGTLATWRQVSCGYRNLAAIKTDGTLWGASSNENGVLGQNNITPRSSPVQVGSMTNWKTVCSGNRWFLALKTDGTLWTCGYNVYGQLGDGTSGVTEGPGADAGLNSKSSPIQVGSLSDWKQISAGSFHALAIKTDGTLWAWGEDTYTSPGFGSGRLGLNYPWFQYSRYSSPVQVGSLNNWKQVAASSRASAAIKTDGTLWTWGSDNYGQLGLNNIIDYSSPVQVGSLTDWRSVSGGRFHKAAIKKDGTLWTWGENGTGALGQGDTINRSSPVKVGALTNWKQVTCGDGWTMAVKTDGTLWSWGRNDFGTLGLNDTTSRSSPVQVGTLTSWKSTADGGCGYYWTAAIQSPDLP
jgi:alpha-tubulin suppressor-like RCC1 family protein